MALCAPQPTAESRNLACHLPASLPASPARTREQHLRADAARAGAGRRTHQAVAGVADLLLCHVACVVAKPAPPLHAVLLACHMAQALHVTARHPRDTDLCGATRPCAGTAQARWQACGERRTCARDSACSKPQYSCGLGKVAMFKAGPSALLPPAWLMCRRDSVAVAATHSHARM